MIHVAKFYDSLDVHSLFLYCKILQTVSLLVKVAGLEVSQQQIY
jgi:hypothetical protein